MVVHADGAISVLTLKISLIGTAVFILTVVQSPIMMQSLIMVHGRGGSKNNNACTTIAINTI
jgi:hypothetical protein